MQIITDQRNVQRGNIQNEHAFTIKASAKAFGVLTNNLYSDKALAIVRELACNAYDSHVAAGCASRPIELILPTKINPQFVVRDFGTGLDHDQILNIYTRFFESTKTESNDFVGQLGLGSKSPFAMFKSFTVEARKDGIRRTYTAFLNEEGIPSIAQMGEVAEACENGVSVSMYVKPGDHEKFANAAKRALMYFNPKPIVSGSASFSTYKVTHGLGGSNWKLRDSEYWARMSGPYVVQGFVVYPIDAALVRETSDMSASARLVSEMNLDFWMDIGSVDVAPSREALSYDKRTVANLAAAFEKVADEMRTVLQADFDTAKTMYEAGCKLYKYEHAGDYSMRRLFDLFDSMHSTQPFTWNGKEITYEHQLDVTKIRSTIVARARSTGRKLQYSSRYEPTTVDTKRVVNLHYDVAVVIDDVFSGSSDLLKQFLDDQNTASSVVVLKATKKAEFNEKEIKSILKMLGDAPAKKLSDLPYKRQPRAKVGGRSKESRLRFQGFPKDGRDRWSSNSLRRVFSRLTWDAVDVDLSKGGYYIPVEGFNAVHNGRVQVYLDDVIHGAVELGLISRQDADNKVFGFKVKEIEGVANDPNWKNLFDHLADQFKQLNIVGQIVDANAVAKLNSDMESFNKYIGQRMDLTKLVDGKFKTFIEKARALNAANKMGNIAAINRFIDRVGLHDLNIVALSTTKGRELTAEWEDVLNAHQMLRFIDWYRVNDDAGVTGVVDYINALKVQ